MGILIDYEEVKKRIQGQLDSREWWVIMAADEHSQALACAIEEKFYTGEASADYELVMIPRPFDGCLIMTIYMARKTRMTMKQLFELTGAPVHQGGAAETDIISCPTIGGLLAAKWLDDNFHSEPQHSLDN